MRPRRRSGITQAAIIGWGGVVVCGFVGVVCVLVAIVNLIRLMTGTGLAPRSDSW